LVDEVTKDQQEEIDSGLAKLDEKTRIATEQDLLRWMKEGGSKWALISEFKYRMPHLRKWVEELEYRHWSEMDASNSELK
jgi:hypothetical protein